MLTKHEEPLKLCKLAEIIDTSSLKTRIESQTVIDKNYCELSDTHRTRVT